MTDQDLPPVTLSLRLDVTPQQAAALTWQLAEQFADGRLPKGFDRIGFIGTASPTAQPAAPDCGHESCDCRSYCRKQQPGEKP